MRVLVAGATGFLGKALVGRLGARGDEVAALARDPGSGAARALAALPGVRAVAWRGAGDSPLLRDEVARADAVVNLAGEPLLGARWTAEVKRRLRASRTETTRALVEAMAASQKRPSVFVSGSAIGFYGARGDEPLAEDAPPGDDFLAQLCRDWEAEAWRAQAAGVRTVVLRTGVVLGRGGGALEQMVRPFRLGAGGPIGSGAQWTSWIHLDDLTGLVLLALDRPEMKGIVNGTAPAPVRNRDLAAALGRALHRPSWLPAPALAVRLAFGEAAGTLLTGQRVVPAAAQAAGYAFRFPDVDGALRDLLGRG